MSTPQPNTHSPTRVRSDLGQRFADIPVSDYVRDFVSLILFGVSLTAPLSGSSDGVVAGRESAFFVLALLAPAFVLSLPYLGRLGLLPGGWTVFRTRLVRRVAAIPFCGLVGWAVVDALISDSPVALGSAYLFGAAAVALSAQTRESELGPGAQDLGPRKASFVAVVGGLATVAVLALVTAVFYLTSSLATAQAVVYSLALIIGVIVSLFAIVAVVVTGGAGWRRTVITLSVGWLILVHFANPATNLLPALVEASSTPRVWIVPLSQLLSASFVLVPALGALVASPAFRDRAQVVRGPGVGFDHIRTLLVTAFVWAVAYLATYAIVFSVDRELLGPGHAAGELIQVVVGTCVIAGAAWLGASHVARHPALSRPGGVLACLAIVGGGLLVMNSASLGAGSSLGHFTIVLIIPVTIAVVMVSDATIRELARTASQVRPVNPHTYEWSERAVVTRQPAVQDSPPHNSVGTTSVMPTMPVQQDSQPVTDAGDQRRPQTGDTQSLSREEVLAVAHTGGQGHSYTREQALNPATDPVVLAHIAEVSPELRPALAENPATYDALLTWLAGIGDPEIDAALERRKQKP